jgi:hypothetical protein
MHTSVWEYVTRIAYPLHVPATNVAICREVRPYLVRGLLMAVSFIYYFISFYLPIYCQFSPTYTDFPFPHDVLLHT